MPLILVNKYKPGIRCICAKQVSSIEAYELFVFVTKYVPLSSFQNVTCSYNDIAKK